MLGVDMMKLKAQQEERLRESEIRRQLISEGVLGEDEDISVHSARKRWYLQRSQEALKYRRKKAAARKRANRLAELPRDRQIHEMSQHILKCMPRMRRTGARLSVSSSWPSGNCTSLSWCWPRRPRISD
ncbi:replication initiation protein [Salmonella enterica subsp. arizonae]|uniref:Replication initiation protein n=1 Tax=Salmonella enterica subsp. arizonae TaxID=59203 RepID=A0A379SEE9_SALER|nr:replication initiation protein [Salmonella enterica subsp. arizonae]